MWLFSLFVKCSRTSVLIIYWLRIYILINTKIWEAMNIKQLLWIITYLVKANTWCLYRKLNIWSVKLSEDDKVITVNLSKFTRQVRRVDVHKKISELVLIFKINLKNIKQSNSQKTRSRLQIPEMYWDLLPL